MIVYDIVSIILAFASLCVLALFIVRVKQKRIKFPSGIGEIVSNLGRNFSVILISLGIVVGLYILAFVFYVGKNGVGGENSVAFWVMDAWNYILSFLSFNIKKGVPTVLIEESLIYEICYTISSLIFYFILYFTIIKFVVNFIKNRAKSRKFFENRATSRDIVFVNSKDEIDEDVIYYLEHNPSTCLWVNDLFSMEDFNNVYNKKFIIFNGAFNVSNLNRIKYNNEQRINFIVFNIRDLNSFFDTLKDFKNDKNCGVFKFYINCDSNLKEFINDVYVSKFDLKQIVYTYSENEIMVRKLMFEHPFSLVVRDEFKNENNSIKKDIKINTFILGLGSLGEEFYRTGTIVNQFVTEDKNVLKALPVNYVIYDEKEESKHDIFTDRSVKFNKLFADKKEYYEAAEDVNNTEFVIGKVNEFKLTEVLLNKITDKSVNYICVCLGSDYLNISYANMIDSLLSTLDKNIDYKIYIRVKNKDLHSKVNENFVMFGNLDEVMSHEQIVNENLEALAIRAHEYYQKDSEYKTNWIDLAPITKEANIFKVVSNAFKLGLLGIKLREYDKNINSTALFNSIYYVGEAKECDYDYSIFLKDRKVKTTRNVIGYQEHLRWNAHYIESGYLPIRRELVLNKQMKKDVSKKLHSCLTSSYGLDDVHKDYAKIANKSVEEVSTYIYDFQDFDDIVNYLDGIYSMEKR